MQEYKDLKVLVIGASGAGKTSFVNLCYCWGLGMKLKDICSKGKALIKTRYLDGDSEVESKLKDQNGHQTIKPKKYSFKFIDPNSGMGYDLDLIDTPGIGDSRGITQDNINIEEIIDSVRKVENLNAILFVISGAETRLTSTIQLVIKKLTAIIPESLRLNIVLLMTNVSFEPKLKAEELFDFSIEPERIFFIDNHIFNIGPKESKNDNTMIKANQLYRNSGETVSAILKEIARLPRTETYSFGRTQEKAKESKLNKQAELLQEYQKLTEDLNSLEMRIREDQAQSETSCGTKFVPLQNSLSRAYNNALEEKEAKGKLERIPVTNYFLDLKRNNFRQQNDAYLQMKDKIKKLIKSEQSKDAILHLILQNEKVCSKENALEEIIKWIDTFQDDRNRIEELLNDEQYPPKVACEYQDIMDTLEFLENLAEEVASQDCENCLGFEIGETSKELKTENGKIMEQNRVEDEGTYERKSLEKFLNREISFLEYSAPMRQESENGCRVEEIFQGRTSEAQEKNFQGEGFREEGSREDDEKESRIKMIKEKGRELMSMIKSHFGISGHGEKVEKLFKILYEIASDDQ